jgi:hypothetical protein
LPALVGGTADSGRIPAGEVERDWAGAATEPQPEANAESKAIAATAMTGLTPVRRC